MTLADSWLTASAIAALMISLAIGIWTWRLPPFPGRVHFTALVGAIVWWTACTAFEHQSIFLAGRIFWSEMAWLGIVATPVFWTLFIWNYLQGESHPAPRCWIFWLMAPSLATWLLALTNEHHHLMYREITQAGIPPLASFHYVHGPAYFFVCLFFYAVMAFCEAHIVFAIAKSRYPYRYHYVGLAAVSLIPWMVHASYVTHVVEAFDPTPFSLALAAAAFFWLIKRQHIFDLLPVAYSTLFDLIPDPILVLDAEGRIAECNAAMRLLAGGRNPVGERPEAIVGLETALAASEAEIAAGTPSRYFEIGQKTLTYGRRRVGRVLLLRDITHRKASESRLESAFKDLETELQDNLVLQQRLHEEAIRDVLTGLHNRRFLAEMAPVLLAESERSGTLLVAAIIDIDHFKRVNDVYGHLAGDVVLRAMGAFLRQNTRAGDAVFRLGGEEFLILLPHTQEDDAHHRIESWRLEFMTQSFHQRDGTDIQVTFSAGIARYPVDAKTLSDLLRSADEALYRAKITGRNRSVLWREEMAEGRPAKLPTGPVEPTGTADAPSLLQAP